LRAAHRVASSQQYVWIPPRLGGKSWATRTRRINVEEPARVSRVTTPALARVAAQYVDRYPTGQRVCLTRPDRAPLVGPAARPAQRFLQRRHVQLGGPHLARRGPAPLGLAQRRRTAPWRSGR